MVSVTNNVCYKLCLLQIMTVTNNVCYILCLLQMVTVTNNVCYKLRLLHTVSSSNCDYYKRSLLQIASVCFFLMVYATNVSVKIILQMAQIRSEILLTHKSSSASRSMRSPGRLAVTAYGEFLY